MPRNGNRFLLRGSLIALLLVAALIVGRPTGARALDKEVQTLVDLCESPIGANRKCTAIADLCDLDTADARKALKLLAKSKDDRTAAMALAALYREDFSSAADAIEDVLEDDKRSAVVREAAMAAHCRRAKKDGKDWAHVASYVRSQAGDDLDLKDAAEQLKGKLWGKEAADE